MKIVYLYTSLTTVGGADRIVIQKANYLADVMGHDVYVITDSQAGRAVIFPLSPKVKHIDLDINFDRQYRHGLLLRSLCFRHSSSRLTLCASTRTKENSSNALLCSKKPRLFLLERFMTTSTSRTMFLLPKIISLRLRNTSRKFSQSVTDNTARRWKFF